MSPIKLSKQEIILLMEAYKKVYKYINELEESLDYQSLPIFVKRPGIRSELSESTIYHFMNEGLILKNLKNIRMNRNKADILAEDAKANEKKIEIKGTGVWEFSQLSEKDINADYLIWVNYGNYIIEDTKTTIDIYILNKPKESLIKPNKISLNKFISIVGDKLELVEIDPIKFKIINKQFSIKKSMKSARPKKINKRLSRVEIIVILAINGMEKEYEEIRKIENDSEAIDKFKEYVSSNELLEKYLIENNIKF